MKNITIDDLRKMDSPSLVSIIDYWKDYSKDSVLLANAELKRRNWEIPLYINKKNEDFCNKNQLKDIKEGLSILFINNGHNTYDDFFEVEKEKNITNELENQLISNNVEIDPYKLISAGTSVKNIVIVLLFAIVAGLFAGLVLINSKDINVIKQCYYFLIFVYIISTIIVLSLLQSVGRHLENSVIKK
jgi:hypothetical protein